MGRVDGKIAFVTGGANGMGRCHVLLLAREGATLVVTDVDEKGGRVVVDEINAEGGRARFIKLDVARSSDWKSAVEETVATFGRVDILINNAGNLLLSTVLDTSEEDSDRVFDINVKGVFYGTKYILPPMQAAGGGSIVNISSMYGLIGAPASAAYQASKGAVRLLTKSTAVDYAPFKIRVNSVHPGIIRTDMTKDILVDEDVAKLVVGTTLLGRPAEPMEVSYVVLFLASDEASFMTGQRSSSMEVIRLCEAKTFAMM